MTKWERQHYKAAIKRDGSKCILCGDTRFQCHHIIYRSHCGTNDERNIVCLCKHHHDMVHANEKRWKPYLLERQRGHYGMFEDNELKHQNKWIPKEGIK